MAGHGPTSLFADKQNPRSRDVQFDDLDETPPKRFLWLKVLIVLVLLAVAGYTYYHFSSVNAARYLLVQENSTIVVKRGRFFPTGEVMMSEYAPLNVPRLLHVMALKSFGQKSVRSLDDVEYELFKLYHLAAEGYLKGTYDKSITRSKALALGRKTMEHALALTRLSKKNRLAIDGTLFKFYLAKARFHLKNTHRVKQKKRGVEMMRGKLALYDALRLRRITDNQRELVDNLLGDVYYLEGKIILANVVKNLRSARKKFNKARKKDAQIYGDSEKWIRFIDQRLEKLKGLDNPFVRPRKPSLKRIPKVEIRPLRTPFDGPPTLPGPKNPLQRRPTDDAPPSTSKKAVAPKLSTVPALKAKTKPVKTKKPAPPLLPLPKTSRPPVGRKSAVNKPKPQTPAVPKKSGTSAEKKKIDKPKRVSPKKPGRAPLFRNPLDPSLDAPL